MNELSLAARHPDTLALPATVSPAPSPARAFFEAGEAVAELRRLYDAATQFLVDSFREVLRTGDTSRRFRAFYPQVSVRTVGHARVDSRLSFGFVPGPGLYATTVTRPDLFETYLGEQLDLLIRNHGQPVEVGPSETPIPLHFALPEGSHVDGASADRLDKPLRDIFDVPDLDATDDRIVNGNFEPVPGEPMPLAPFTAQRVDYSLHRLAHYTATSPRHFQNFVLFTNYGFYVDEFCALARRWMAEGGHGYDCFVEPGNVVTRAGASHAESGLAVPRLPQMPAYHLARAGQSGITLVNIGVGPSNAKTITDHVAVLRPHAWLMLGHCAGLRNTQALGDYVLAHAYVREDHVLDADLPVWVPIPALAEVQVALEEAVASVTGLSGYDLKRIMRTGTVATIDNRNWELRDQREPVERLSKSRAVALDMESATIAANGYRFRVPYGTLLCVSDKPLHGELKLPGMATDFYKRQVSQHLEIGIRAMQSLADMPHERLHSRKLRSFFETAFQ
ncbi:AMP nucleosidase [Aureimonas jatrophae]|uniref:AMP nucleosidase n=1 Tax=Aureimonas jatrophae TaxID=1166073 RepID=A0A1H0CS01_9HYPH|nr:AMP nucleosidase [Aureimonas jatrophae]MBB3949363.1 AMP nucleosidase [Aureimonas jatrophae]SDN60689.1 AMP nucleosidase [Aureimonas jatrophae]